MQFSVPTTNRIAKGLPTSILGLHEIVSLLAVGRNGKHEYEHRAVNHNYRLMKYTNLLKVKFCRESMPLIVHAVASAPPFAVLMPL